MFKMFQLKNLKILLIVLIAAASTGAAFYFYSQYQTIKKNPDLVYKGEDKKTIESISKYMQLPQGEEPSIATILDITKLKDQKFFENAQNGDKIIIYNSARKAILWRPTTNKIIEVAPLVLGDQAQTTSQTQTAAPAVASTAQVSVALYNGAGITGLTKKAEERIAGIGDINVVARTNAAKNDYSKTLVVDLTGKNGQLAAELAGSLGGEVGQLPAGEAKPEADILIIAGQDINVQQ